MIAVAQNDGSGSSSFVLAEASSSSANTYLAIGYDLSEHANITQRSDGDTAQNQAGTTVLSGVNVILWFSDGSDYVIDANGSVEVNLAGDGDWGGDTGSTTPVDNTSIGALRYNSTVANFLDGAVYEIYVWDGVVSLPTVRSKATDLISTYGI